MHGARAIGSSGADGERGKKVERGAVVGYIEVGRPDVAGKVADLAGDVGEVEEERESGGNFKSPAVCGRASWREVRGRWAATWACGTGGVGAGNGGNRRRRGRFRRRRCRRLEEEEGADRWAPPVGDPERGGREWAGPAERRASARDEWADGPTKEKGKKKRRKRKKIFPGI